MIQVVSNKFKVKCKEYTLKWFIECVCGFTLYEEDEFYYFQGANQEYLTTLALDIEEVTDLDIPKFPLEDGLIEVGFDVYIQLLLTSDLIYWEIDTESINGSNCVTTITSNSINSQRLVLSD